MVERTAVDGRAIWLRNGPLRHVPLRASQPAHQSHPVSRCRLALGLLACALPAVGALPAHAQDAWPTKPINYVVPFAAGGTTDVCGIIGSA